jgi:hypothetical protein
MTRVATRPPLKNLYEPMVPDERGRLWLEAAGLWLGVADGRVYLEDEHGNRLPDYEELAKQLDDALTRVAAEVQARRAAEAKATAAEGKLRELEAKLARRSNGKRSNGAK